MSACALDGGTMAFVFTANPDALNGMHGPICRSLAIVGRESTDSPRFTAAKKELDVEKTLGT